jgi:hypothetical protein
MGRLKDLELGQAEYPNHSVAESIDNFDNMQQIAETMVDSILTFPRRCQSFLWIVPDRI